MEQLELKFSPRSLEESVQSEFSKIKEVWEAFHYATENDPRPNIRYFGRYYVPRNSREMKAKLKQMYPMSNKLINSMNAKQARMVYHRICKFLTSY